MGFQAQLDSTALLLYSLTAVQGCAFSLPCTGQVKHVDIAGCGFLNPAAITAHKPSGSPTSPAGSKSSSRGGSQAGQRTKTAAVFDAREPDGSYTLDLATPADRQVCQLDKCTIV